MSAMESLEPVRKVLAYRKRPDLAELLVNARLDLIPSNISEYNLVLPELRTAVIHAPIEDCDRLKAFPPDDYEAVLNALHEVYPPQACPISITNITWVVDRDSLVNDTRDVESLLDDIEAQKLTMIANATGIGVGPSAAREYAERHDDIDAALDELGLKNPNRYRELWQWTARWSMGDLPSYQERRVFVEAMYEDTVRRIHARLSGRPALAGEPAPTARAPGVEGRGAQDRGIGSAVDDTKTSDFKEWAGGSDATLAIVFTDIVGSTELAGDLGDEQMDKVGRAHATQTQALATEHDGHVLKGTGDGFLCAFRSAVQALDFALALLKQPGDSRISIRIGIHVGIISAHKDDASGLTLSIARRVCDMCPESGIWMSDEAMRDVKQKRADRHSRLTWEAHTDCELKGLPGRRILWSLRTG